MKLNSGAGIVLSVVAFLGCSAGNHRSPDRTTGAPVIEPTVVSQESESQTALIKPGSGVGVIRLGDSRENLVKVIGGKFEEYSHDSPCKYTEMHWYDLDADRNGLFVYLTGGRVTQIESDSPRYRTAEGISSDASAESVRSKYRDLLQAYILLGSGSKVNGGRDLVYWVDRQNGIAFEFYYNHKAKNRRVSKIIVFEPNTDFQPEGCLSPPQELRKLRPFALEG
jgi:hypothetical protein